MKLQSTNSVNFTAKFPFASQKTKATIIEQLTGQGISFKEVDGVICTGRDLTQYIKQQSQVLKSAVAVDTFSQGVKNAIFDFKAGYK